MHWLDPDYLPKTTGTLDRFVLNPKADIDGLLLTDGTEIHTPPHLSSKLLAALAPGGKLTVHGVKTRHGDVIVAVAIDPAQRERIVDTGPGHMHDKYEKSPHPAEKHGKSALHQGAIKRLLHGPKGHSHGVLLDDGVVVRFPPHAANSFADLLVIDALLSVHGVSCTTEHGTVIDAEAMGMKPSTLIEVAKRPEHASKKPKKGPPTGEHGHHH